MITTVLTSIFLIAPLVSDSATYRVFELSTASNIGLYRVHVTDEMTPLWKREGRLKVFDAAAEPLLCASVVGLRLQNIVRSYKLSGEWLKDDVAWSLPEVNHFAVGSVWRFDVPSLADDEYPMLVSFTWSSTIDNPGEVQLSIGKDLWPDRRSLAEGRQQSTQIGARMFFYFDPREHRTSPWPPKAELRFSLVSDEIAVAAPELETASSRPWMREMPIGSWYVFHGNGKTPYRVEVGEGIDFCSGLGADDLANNSDPNWPTESIVVREVVDSPKLGKKR